MIMPSIAVLAGGPASRLYPVAKDTPKAMLEVAGKPFIAHQLNLFKRNNIPKVVICSGYLGKQIEDYVKDGRDFGLEIKFSFDGEKLLGTAGAIKKALPLLGDIFFVIYGDSYLETDFKPVYEYFISHDKMGLMAIFKNESRWDKSNIIYSNGEIIKYDKKNTSSEMKYIDYGLPIFRKEAFMKINDNQVFDLVDLCRDLIDSGQMLSYEVYERFFEIGSFQGLEETRRYLEARKQEE